MVVALGWDRPVLVGHSTGGYAVTAAAAAGVVDSGALCVIDGLVLDDRETTALGIDAGHNVPMTRPAELASIIVDLVHRVDAAAE